MGELDNKLFEFYKRMYFWEIEQQDRINRRVPTLLGLILAVVGFQAYLTKNILPVEVTCSGMVAAFLLVIGWGCLIVSAVLLKLAWYGPSYSYMPAAKRLEEHRKRLQEHLRDNVPEQDGWEGVSAEFEKDLYEYFIEDGTFNFDVNKTRTWRLYWAFNWLLGSIGAGVISFILLTLKDGLWKS